MSADHDPVAALNEDESWSLLSSVRLGRLVTILGGQPEVFPVNFAVQRRTVLFRTAQGTKLFSAVMNDRVAFEADNHTVDEGWSVVIKGRAHVLSATDEILEAQDTELLPMVKTLKPLYVRVVALEITGRRFKFGPEPDRESTFA
ncbi:pyridoxamine 5'-phosphate oxidase family protein [Mycobacterium sp.]|uniref:pyridoxamine 5'-phosphate oxidase family protein n=1 Tax=Mycobacterium sp. TaxID=1785 RepID=UPI003BACFFBB